QKVTGAYIYPIQYYMSLSNHAGNLITAGDFDSSHKYAKDAIGLVNLYGEINFPRIEVPINNFILSGYLSKSLNTKECIQLIESLFKYLGDSIDQRILLRNNFIIFKALNNELEDAFTLAKQLTEMLSKATRKDAYYEYFLGINFSVINYLVGDKPA